MRRSWAPPGIRPVSHPRTVGRVATGLRGGAGHIFCSVLICRPAGYYGRRHEHHRSSTVTNESVYRAVIKLVRGQATSDGAGVKLTRVVGTQALPDLDPFLLLDEFGSDDPSA